MKKVFLVHGYQGEPNGGWRPWLMGKLAKENIWACALAMPTPDKPVLSEWVRMIQEAVGVPTEDIILVGHSLGVPAIFSYLETLKEHQKISGVVAVSGLVNEEEEPYSTILSSFFDRPYDLENIKNKADLFAVIHGDNDSQAPYKGGVEISKRLGCKLITIPNGGHLNGSSGWYELPEALEAVLEITKK